MSTQDVDRVITAWLAVDRGSIDPTVMDTGIAEASRRLQRRGLAAALAGERAWPSAGRAVALARGTTGFRLALLALLALILVAVSAALVAGGPQLRLLVEGPTRTAPMPSAQTQDPNSADPVGTGTVVYSTGGCLHTIDIATGTTGENCEPDSYTVLGGGIAYESWSWSPDGRQAIGTGLNSLLLRTRTDATGIPLRDTAGFVLRSSNSGQGEFGGWSPRETYFWWVGQTAKEPQPSVFIGSVDDPRRSQLSRVGADGYGRVEWSADERRAIVDLGSHHAHLVNGDGSPVPGTIDFDLNTFLGISSDGSRLAFLAPFGGGSAPVATNVAAGDGLSVPMPVTNFPAGTFAIAAAWSQDDSTLAVISKSGGGSSRTAASFDLWLVDINGTPRRIPLTLPVGAYPHGVTWSADGNHVIVTSQEGEVSSYPYKSWAQIVSTADGQTIVADAGGAVFSPDGRDVLYDVLASNGSNDLMLMDLSTGRSRRIGGSVMSLGEASQLNWWR